MHPSRSSTRRRSRTLSVSIARSPQAVYDVVADPLNLPRWAGGLGSAVRKSADGWIVESANGPVGLRFAARNAFGVLDHWVNVGPGVEVYVPMRVIANGDASEVIFTLFQTLDMSAATFAADAALVQRDLDHLKRLLEA
jgi:hypothetical protein